MGVTDLWTLVQPIGRYISIETLSGKTLAIDMSIWVTHIIKAMRDKDGNMIQNAHISATIKRILKLLFNKIKPIFVFDGKPPDLKSATLAGISITISIIIIIINSITIINKLDERKEK